MRVLNFADQNRTCGGAASHEPATKQRRFSTAYRHIACSLDWPVNNMDRTKFALISGSLVFAVVATWRFSAEGTAPAPQRPLQLIVPLSARAAAPAAPPETSASAAPAAAATAAAVVNAKPALPEPRQVVRVASPAASTIAAVSEVVRPRATPRVTPTVTAAASALDYTRSVADAASIGVEEPARATYRLERIAAADPTRPEAYETLAALHLRQGDFYQAYEGFESAIRNGGKATFSIMHDHTRGNFDTGARATCVGALTIEGTELAFEGADGHRFSASWADVREVGANRFFGSGIGGFHVRVAADGKSGNFNLAPRSRDKREANIILDLLIEHAQRQEAR